jgi:uncharacterized glyoxalase superfamily protein PhnB
MQGVVPLLQVGSMTETLNYYQRVLGFRLEFIWPDEDNPKWVGLSRDGISFMLTIDLGTSSGRFIAEKGNGVVLYVVVDDVEVLYDELQMSGAIVVQEMREFGGRRQFSIADPNGYVIAFSQAFG